ncbi:3-hydroxyacyl-CoA dehydrogenase NAD-binding domain-containing protein [Parachitinimonas caeni]|uniref:3-hydroxyacyl-CoA dehydrogenase NAD-binding domain-containing protein n=1 Tax=Parachitinimonas caeni TaxID=3031301 RepID=A0ABT7DRX4_9NEIS|nr:3-hydroxyacyl-CoA dehydrogenase NAD-binding domain-containing protein [Parachitinimonas caeni]MDK2122827.1 3-hydroxyacyl-CoA dehydrogenase NAD-binding domain-containing protein [Parachitinimonas caeni]
MIDYQLDQDGIATLCWNLPGKSQNVLNAESLAAFYAAIDRALAEPGLRGILLTSAKHDFIAGGDLDMLAQADDAQALFDLTMRLHQGLRKLETCGKPVAAALNGNTLGGGLEVALACHYRVAADSSSTRIGLPEATLGLLPGGGGTQRLPRLIGIQPALPLLLEGKRLKVADAAKLGIVQKVVPAGEEIVAARAWLLGEGQSKPQQPWDSKGFKIPGGAVQSPGGMQTFIAGNALTREKSWGNYPALRYILSCVYEGMQTDLDTGLKIEARYFVAAVRSPEARNMIRSLFFGMQAANKLADRPAGVPEQSYSRIGVLGAGMMGAGIANVAAQAGLDVVLIDTSLEAAERGRQHARDALARSRKTPEQIDAIVSRIHPATDMARLEGCELVIEAVFEDRAIKADVTRRAEAMLSNEAIFASNTSTLPISSLAEASARPEQFIGLHFFSPVEKMPLVEIIVGKQTSAATLARAMDLVKRIGKTPIIVNDSRGFYTSRVFDTYISEGMALLAEGVAPALIEHAGRLAGMPVGPLALTDEVSLELILKVTRQTEQDLGAAFQPKPAYTVIKRLVNDLGRLGRKAGQGFYDYDGEGGKRLWSGLAQEFPLAADQPDVETVKQRLLHVQAVEAAKCLDEGVLRSKRDADIGAILGWGFPACLGGPLSYIDTVGAQRFVAECDALASRYGQRFAVPASLKQMAASGERYHPR